MPRIGELWATRRRLVFSYDIFVLLLLLLVAVLYVKYKGPPGEFFFKKYAVFAHSMWLGALGGVIISLKASTITPATLPGAIATISGISAGRSAAPLPV